MIDLSNEYMYGYIIFSTSRNAVLSLFSWKNQTLSLSSSAFFLFKKKYVYFFFTVIKLLTSTLFTIDIKLVVITENISILNW